jgi:hypothetical protein
MRGGFVLPSLALLGAARAWTFSKTSSGGGAAAGTLTLSGVGAGPFDPSRVSNWLRDERAPLIAPRATPAKGFCPGNIYAASAVNNGGAVNVFFGGWDGVSSCHDSVSVAVTEDDFENFGAHVPAVATGAEMHVNNPSAIKLPDDSWGMLYTQLPTAPAAPLNKPGFSTSADGVAFAPGAGGAAQLVTMRGYAGWETADVNGGNVLVYAPSGGRGSSRSSTRGNSSTGSSGGGGGSFHMYFVDFAARNHSVYHATADAGNRVAGAPLAFSFAGVALQERGRIPNDVKLINGHWVLGLHANSQQTYMSSVSGGVDGGIGGGPPSSWPASRVLFRHRDAADNYIVSVGLVTDGAATTLRGALYGAGAVPQLNNNRVFATWLQRRAIFRSSDNTTVWGLGDATSAHGPDKAVLRTNAASLAGRWFLHDTDYVDEASPGTLLAVSPQVTVATGDVWQAAE